MREGERYRVTEAIRGITRRRLGGRVVTTGERRMRGRRRGGVAACTSVTTDLEREREGLPCIASCYVTTYLPCTGPD